VSDPSGTDVPPEEGGEGEHTVDLGITGIEEAAEIGIGGFGRVYRARQPAFGREVGVKVLSVGKLDEKAQSRFERECQAMGALGGHPNIVTIYDAGTTDDGRPYLIMEYMPGGSYDDRIRDQGPLAWQEAAEVGAKVSAALQVAHERGIIHRDIKPANVLISQYGEAQLGDFGIARITGGSETRSGVITASMAHASPEVLDGKRPTEAADIYAVGSMVYELITGNPAFFHESDETNLAMINRIYHDPVPDVRSLGVPDSVARVMERSMAKDPAARPMTAGELAEQFREALRQGGDDKAADEAEKAAEEGAAVAAAAGAAAMVVELEDEAGAEVPAEQPTVPDPSATTALPSAAAGLSGPPPGAPSGPPPGGPAGPPVPPQGPVGFPPPGGPGAPPGAPPGMPPGARPFGDVPPPGSDPRISGQHPVPKKKTNLVPIFAGVGAIVLLLIIAGGAFALTSGGGGGDDPPPTTPDPDPSTEPTDGPFDPGGSGSGTSEIPEGQEPGDLGSNDALNALVEPCFEGDMGACNSLWWSSDSGSTYEDYGDTCGGRDGGAADADGLTTCISDYDFTIPEGQSPGSLGSESDLDELAEECAEGDFGSCDELYSESDVGSDYEAYAKTCGGRLPTEALDELLGSTCASTYEDE
jgi:serine/threonine-protein kinase PknK